MPLAQTEPLDELRVLVIVDNETDTLSSVVEGLPLVSEVAHLEGRVPTSLVHEGHPGKVIIDRALVRVVGEPWVEIEGSRR